MSRERKSRRPLASVGPSCNNVATTFTSANDECCFHYGNKRKAGESDVSSVKRRSHCISKENDTLLHDTATENEGIENKNTNIKDPPPFTAYAKKVKADSKDVLSFLASSKVPAKSQTPPPPDNATSSPAVPISFPFSDIQRLLLIHNRSHLYSRDFGIDDHHNNFWCAVAYERGAGQVDAVHPGPYFVNFPRLPVHERLEVAFHIGLLADELHSRPPAGASPCACPRMPNHDRYIFCSRAATTLGLACQIFDRFMSIVKQHDSQIGIYRADRQRHVLYPFYVDPKFINIPGISHLNYLIALSCYCIADRREAIRGIEYTDLLEVWQLIARKKNLVGYAMNPSYIDIIKNLERNILVALKSQVGFPTASTLAESLLGPRTNSSQFRGRSGNGKYWSVAAEAQLLLRLAATYPKIGLVFSPSIQATAASELASQFKQPLTWNDEFLKTTDGTIRRDMVNRCTVEMIKVFLKLCKGGVTAGENLDPKEATINKLEIDIAQWMLSLSFQNDSKDFLMGLVLRYETYLEMIRKQKESYYIQL